MRFYKYAAWIGEAGDYTRKNLMNNVVYLNSPDRFNDPFDFNPVYDSDSTYQEKLSHFIGINIRHKKLSKEKARRAAIEMLRSHPAFKNKENLAKFAYGSKEWMRRQFGVTCFSSDPKSSPMWHHYADQHKGICIEWELPEDRSVFSLPDNAKKCAAIWRKVEYAEERPISRIFDDQVTPDSPLYLSLLTKSIDWKYEKEYRLIVANYIGQANYNPLFLTGIIIGFKMPENTINEFKEFIRRYLTVSPRLFRAHPSKYGYNYDLEPLR